MDLDVKVFTPPPENQTKPPFAVAVTAINSLIITRRFWGISDFELHAGMTEKNLRALKIGNLLYKGQALYIIKSVEFTHETNRIVANGMSLSAYLSDRHNLNCTNYVDQSLDTICREFVDKNLISATRTFSDSSASSYLSNSRIPHLKIGDPITDAPKVSKQDSDSEILPFICDLCQSNDIGFRIRFELNTWSYFFELFRGVDRTIDQNDRPACVFSREYDTVMNEQYLSSEINYKNTAFVKGEGDGEMRKCAFVQFPLANGSMPTGTQAKELFVDARDIRQEEGVSDSAYCALLEQRGREKLSERLMLQTINQTLVPNSCRIYRRDWDLGDMVTVVNRTWGLRLNTRITEIQEVYEPHGVTITPTLGNNTPTLTDKIKQLTKR